jgi:hypothetical protein
MSTDNEKPKAPSDHPAFEAFRRAPVVTGRASDEERAALAHDPVWQAIVNAPIDDEPEIEEEIAAMAAGASGPFIPHEEVMARLRGTVEGFLSLLATRANQLAPQLGAGRRRRSPEAIARLGASFAAAPPEWQKFFGELDRRDPKMRSAQ